jgi:uncharacterized protein YecT (DUF1311 family)
VIFRSRVFYFLSATIVILPNTHLQADGHVNWPLNAFVSEATESDRMLACVGGHVKFCGENDDLSYKFGACLSQEEVLWDAKVRREFEATRAYLVSAVPMALSLSLDREMRDEQAAWVKYRDARCRSLRTVFGLAGTGAKHSQYCAMNMAAARLTGLLALREQTR